MTIDKKQRQCCLCEYGNFNTTPPSVGECRQLPPRSYLEKSGGSGRFFPMVRHDDWCGRFSLTTDSARIYQTEISLFEYKNHEDKITYVKDNLNNSESWEKGVELLKSIFESEPSKEVAELIYDMYRTHDKLNKVDESKNAFEWAIKASDFGSEKCIYLAGLYFAQGKVCEIDISKANEYLKRGAELGHKRAINKLEAGGFKPSESD